jgi:hypothetical protein
MKKNKKSIVILLAVAVIVVVGIVSSMVVDWPVDMSKTSGNIGKSVRFSSKASTEEQTNMEELLITDTAYQKDIVSAYAVMKNRAQQFNALVESSNEEAGEIEEFADLLKEMNKMQDLVNNACAQLDLAGEDLDAVLSGEERPDLEQNTSNAWVAYTTLQKQNYLADRFIETTDKYLKSNNLNMEELMLVRDSWMSYQQETAALENDTKATKRLEEQGYLLSNKQTLELLRSRGPRNSELLGSRGPRNSELLGCRGPRNSELLGSRGAKFSELLGCRGPRNSVISQ